MDKNNFDRELINYLQQYFNDEKIEQLKVKSQPIDNNIYQIRFENEEIVLQFFYEAEDENCEAQIRITNILLKGKMQKNGLSKRIINKLFDFCNIHGDMSLWIYDLINQDWCKYLINHGAKMVKEETKFEGAILLISNKII